MKYVFILHHSKNILKTLPREIPSSLILSCLHKRLCPPCQYWEWGLTFFRKQKGSTLFLITQQGTNPKSYYLRPLAHSAWDAAWHYLHLLLVFPEILGFWLGASLRPPETWHPPVLPWDIWFHSSATGLGFLFLGRQGQLGMRISSCLGFPLTGGGSGRMWGTWRPLMMLLSQRAGWVMKRTGAVDWVSFLEQVGIANRASTGIRTNTDLLKVSYREGL